MSKSVEVEQVQESFILRQFNQFYEQFKALDEWTQNDCILELDSKMRLKLLFMMNRERVNNEM